MRYGGFPNRPHRLPGAAMSGVETCPDCRDTGIISRPYIAGVVSTMTACHCDAGRQFAADIAAQRARQMTSELPEATRDMLKLKGMI